MSLRLVAMDNMFPSCTSPQERYGRIIAAGYERVYLVAYPAETPAARVPAKAAHAAVAAGLEVQGAYLNLDLGQPDWRKDAERIVGELSLPVIEVSIKRSNAMRGALDEQEVGAVTSFFEWTARIGTEVDLYPHFGYPISSLTEARSMIPRVGARALVFPLSHMVSLVGGAAVHAELENHADRIKSVNICGCVESHSTPPAKAAIVPLGQGYFDVRVFLLRLTDLGYGGPVMLQGYGWTGDLDANLRSCLGWFSECHD